MGRPQHSQGNDEPENSVDHQKATQTTRGAALVPSIHPNRPDSNSGMDKKRAHRSDRRILSRPDGIISNIEDATYTVLRKHQKESS